MARRKVVLVIVEGLSDETALGFMLSEIYKPDQVRIEVMRCDITSDVHSSPGNIVKKVGACITKCMQEYSVRLSDIIEVIQITDTDGAFVSDDAVLYDECALHPVYSEESIFTNNPDGIIDRNRRKSANLRRLINTKHIFKNKIQIPYSIYFMSCNLDHALYGKLNTAASGALCF